MYFYKDLFTSLCFIVFGAALAFKYPSLFMAAMLLAALSRTAAKKKWEDPAWFTRLAEHWRERHNS